MRLLTITFTFFLFWLAIYNNNVFYLYTGFSYFIYNFLYLELQDIKKLLEEKVKDNGSKVNVATEKDIQDLGVLKKE